MRPPYKAADGIGGASRSDTRGFVNRASGRFAHRLRDSDATQMNRWLARFAISFFIIAAVLAWSAFQSLQHHAPLWQSAVDLFGAAAAITMGAVGTRAKHSRFK